MTFYFYDLETSGISSRAQRIMQFAGQRTNQQFEPVGEPHNWLISLTDEVVPDPEAILLTGLTPQRTHQEGFSEAEFLKFYLEQVVQPDTVMIGFNNLRFDDEFIRHTLWRNLYNPYSWHSAQGRSRWDLLDASRMIRALRPAGINWPVDEHNQPTNRLELLAQANKLEHTQAHDALSDVQATISLARLLKAKQPKIFDYLLQLRSKSAVSQLFNFKQPQPLIYSSGRYSSQWQKTTAVLPIGSSRHGSILVYDLRLDPRELSQLNDAQLRETAFSRQPETEILAVKPVKPNTCPALAPLGVLDTASQKRLQLPLATVKQHYQALQARPELTQRLQQLFEVDQAERQQGYQATTDPDFQLYDGFIEPADTAQLSQLHRLAASQLAQFQPEFRDQRLSQLLLRYKARVAPASLSQTERKQWETYRQQRLQNGVDGQLPLNTFMERLAELATGDSSSAQQFLIEELRLYAESLVPSAD